MLTGRASAKALKAPWAMVPLNPNELRRDADMTGPTQFSSTRATASTGVWNDDVDMIDHRCAFNLKRGRGSDYSRDISKAGPPELSVDRD